MAKVTTATWRGGRWVAVALAGIAIAAGSAARARSQAEAPAPQANITFEEGATTTGWLPIELWHERYIFLRGTVNGRETSMVLDSGAGMTVVDESFARTLGLKLEGGVTAVGVAGRTKAHLASSVAVGLGQTRLKPARVVVIDLESVTARLGREMPVILGADVFASTIVDVDYPHARLALHDARPYRYAGPGHRMPLFRVSERRYQIEAQVEGRPAARFELDTGSADTVVIFRTYADQQRLLDARAPVSTRQMAGVGGATVGRVATLRTFTLAGRELSGVPATFASAREGALATSRSAGMIGAGLLSRFRVIFDVSRDTLYLEAGEHVTRPFEKDRAGLYVEYRKGRLEVMHVAAGSPAEKAGWRVGDSVTAFDGRPASPDYWASWKAAITAAAGATITLRDGRGRERTLVLADYY